MPDVGRLRGDSMALVQSTLFAVVDQPYCLWGVDLRERNLDFLDGIDAEYFEHLATSGLNALNRAEAPQRVAAALRMGFYHGTETLFSLLGALLQAPDCAYAWIAKCKNPQLRDLLTCLNRDGSGLLLKATPTRPLWDGISKDALAYSNPDPDKAERNGQLFGRLWKRLASEYLEKVHVDEYNSLKHGFRVRPGGFRLAFGAEHEYGVFPPPEEMHSLGGSEFGSTFYVLEQIGGQGGDNRSRRSRQVSVNWSAEGTALALDLVSMSIRNVVSALQILNGKERSEVRFVRPPEDSDFVRPWKDSPRVKSINLDVHIPDDAVRATTRQELLDMWPKTEPHH